MKVVVRHFFSLRRESAQGPREIELDPGALVCALLQKIEIDKDLVGVLIVNGKQATFSQKLNENDNVTIIPHIAGG